MREYIEIKYIHQYRHFRYGIIINQNGKQRRAQNHFADYLAVRLEN